MESLNFFADIFILAFRVFSIFASIMLIIFVHEMGHYLVGRWCGIGASVFSLGFGPEIFSFHDKRGTRWRLALIPLGGYVKFLGDDNIASSNFSKTKEKIAGSFADANAFARAATVFAGPLFNALFTIVLLAFYFMNFGKVVTEPVIGSIVQDSPAEIAGLQKGDRILEINGNKIDSFQTLIAKVSLNGGDALNFTMERMGQSFDVSITPKVLMRDDGFGNSVRVGMIGVGAPVDPNNPRFIDPSYQKNITYGFFTAIGEAVDNTVFIVTQTVHFITRLIQGKEDRCQLSGPSKTANIAWQVSESGSLSMLNLVAFISISVGIINLFPLPPLDGGHLLFYLIEGALGRPVPKRIQEVVFSIGLFFVLAFMVFSVSNDYLCWFK